MEIGHGTWRGIMFRHYYRRSRKLDSASMMFVP
jgi:hypothetical protein